MTTDIKYEKAVPGNGCWAPGALFPGLQLRVMEPGVRVLVPIDPEAAKSLADLMLLLCTDNIRVIDSIVCDFLETATDFNRETNFETFRALIVGVRSYEPKNAIHRDLVIAVVKTQQCLTGSVRQMLHSDLPWAQENGVRAIDAVSKAMVRLYEPLLRIQLPPAEKNKTVVKVEDGGQAVIGIQTNSPALETSTKLCPDHGSKRSELAHEDCEAKDHPRVSNEPMLPAPALKHQKAGKTKPGFERVRLQPDAE